MPTNWKYIKKLLEKEFLCEKLRKHITYDFTYYKPATWFQEHFIMKYEDEILLEAYHPCLEWDPRYKALNLTSKQEHAIEDWICQRYEIQKRGNFFEYISPVASIIRETDRLTNQNRGVFGVDDIFDAIGFFLHADIQKSLDWDRNDFVRALAILDRRCGKRRLVRYAQRPSRDLPDWLKRIYVIRFDAEGIPYHEEYGEKRDW